MYPPPNQTDHLGQGVQPHDGRVHDQLVQGTKVRVRAEKVLEVHRGEVCRRGGNHAPPNFYNAE